MPELPRQQPALQQNRASTPIQHLAELSRRSPPALPLTRRSLSTTRTRDSPLRLQLDVSNDSELTEPRPSFIPPATPASPPEVPSFHSEEQNVANEWENIRAANIAEREALFQRLDIDGAREAAKEVNSIFVTLFYLFMTHKFMFKPVQKSLLLLWFIPFQVAVRKPKPRARVAPAPPLQGRKSTRSTRGVPAARLEDPANTICHSCGEMFNILNQEWCVCKHGKEVHWACHKRDNTCGVWSIIW